VRGGVNLSKVEDYLEKYFTDFDGKFDAQLSNVSVSRVETDERFGTSSPYTCRVKAQYNRDLLRLLDDGMLLASRNFRSDDVTERYTLVEIVRFWPEHFGLRGVRDYQYFPMQFEVIQQSVDDWETDDKTTMMIQLAAIPINYDLVLEGDKPPDFDRGFSYPVVGSQVYVLSRELIRNMYNRGIPEALTCEGLETCADARRDPRLGTIKMFEATGEEIPLYVDFDSLVRYHFGIFAFTGGGKSNLMSNVLRRILVHKEDVKVVIFDISCEYPFLLMDVFADPSIPCRIILENEVRDVEDFYNSVVKPKEYEADRRVVEGMGRIFTLGRVSHLRRARMQVPQFVDLLGDIERMKDENAKNPNYVEALDDIEELALAYMEEEGLREDDLLTEEFVERLIGGAQEVAESYRVHQMSALYGWFQSRIMMRRYFQNQHTKSEGFSVEEVEELLEGETRLVCLSISEPATIKRFVIDLTHDLLLRRKREFKVKPHVLFVWDEAQEFVAHPSNVSGIDKTCSQEVERLLRQGRKYGLGGCIATQRIAYLNTNALQQLHTYFVSTLPRPYDRGLISNTFMIDKTILEKTLEFVPGEWLLSSYLATGIANVPIFMKADNAEDEVENFVKHLKSVPP
jgi:DNA helicase HerA-like ATPase